MHCAEQMQRIKDSQAPLLLFFVVALAFGAFLGLGLLLVRIVGVPSSIGGGLRKFSRFRV